MAKVCLCLTASTIERNLEILNKYRNYTDIAELRADCLEPDERLAIRHFPRLAGIPTILTVRRDIDGGCFSGGEGARIKMLARGLAYAEADSRLNFAYVDIEEDLRVPSLEEAARAFGTRIISSYHNIHGTHSNIPAKIKSMQRAGDELIKIAVTVKSTADALNVFRASKVFPNQDIVLICMGHYGVFNRILAERFGSSICYTSALNESKTAAPGQIDVKELIELYRFNKINKNTKVYGALGNPLRASFNPRFFNAIFALEDIDAVYVPFPADSIDDFMELAGELEVQGFSVEAPYNEAVLSWLNSPDFGYLQTIGSCNTMSRSQGKWFGDNTGVAGFSQSILKFLGKKDLKRQKITIIGAGSAARTVAAGVSRLGGKALILNRTPYKARSIALLYDFSWGGLDSQGFELIRKYSDIIIQTTSAEAETEGNVNANLFMEYAFTGKEAVMDLVCKPKVTAFLERAAAAGCRTINGHDMFMRQACLQYTCFTGKEVPQKHLRTVKLDGG